MIKIQAITGPVERELRQLNRRVDRATSKAINRALLDVQEWAVEKLLPQSFTLRSKWWKPRSRFGFNIGFAKEGRLKGTLGSQADWLRGHDKGAVRSPVKGKAKAVPVGPLRGNRPIRKAKRPRTLLDKAKHFIAKDSSGMVGIYRRKYKKKRYPIELFYKLQPTVRVPAGFQFEAKGQPKALTAFKSKFAQEMQKEIAKARTNA